MRRLLRDIASGQEMGDVTTLRDPTVMDTLKQKVAARGRTRSRRFGRLKVALSIN